MLPLLSKTHLKVGHVCSNDGSFLFKLVFSLVACRFEFSYVTMMLPLVDRHDVLKLLSIYWKY